MHKYKKRNDNAPMSILLGLRRNSFGYFYSDLMYTDFGSFDNLTFNNLFDNITGFITMEIIIKVKEKSYLFLWRTVDSKSEKKWMSIFFEKSKYWIVSKLSSFIDALKLYR